MNRYIFLVIKYKNAYQDKPKRNLHVNISMLENKLLHASRVKIGKKNLNIQIKFMNNYSSLENWFFTYFLKKYPHNRIYIDLYLSVF